jgi:hypothetical protein
MAFLKVANSDPIAIANSFEKSMCLSIIVGNQDTMGFTKRDNKSPRDFLK